ncbi:UNVERIFIED_CONTAM: hypothetical protein Sradi_3022400 [Sesamum radiatum]|uniref:Flagellar hook-length control protein FliK n=1 Tax=Sesamum radiatum TaxID=300843 RepID=A0AAW2S3H6_SESRA
MPHPAELSSNLLGTLQQMITSAITSNWQSPAQVITRPEVVIPEQADPALAIPRTDVVEGPAQQLPAQAGGVPPQWLA